MSNINKLFTFDLFWEAYDKKIGAKKCKVIFERFDINTRSKIIDHAIQYAQSTPDKQYRKNPLTYLHGEHWQDEIIGSEPVKFLYKDVVRIHNNPKDERTMQDFEFDNGIWNPK